MTVSEPLRTDLEQIELDVDEIDATHVLEGVDDTVLLQMARGGSTAALGALYSRYRPPAARYARHLGLGAEADDVISDTFAHILDLLSRGKGPESAFRAYLFTSVRHEAGRRAKARQRVVPTGDAEDLDEPVQFGNGELDLFERGMVRNAYQSLPERWRAVLWELDVEGRSPSEIGENHGMSPNAVSALVYRARSGLRESYLQQHVGDHDSATSNGCAPARAALGAVVRGTAHKRLSERVFTHLGTCGSCHEVYMELNEVNRELGAVSITTAVATAGVVGTAALSSGVSSGLVGWLSAVKGYAASAVVPAVAVGAVAIVPVVVEADAPANADVSSTPAHRVTVRGVAVPAFTESKEAGVRKSSPAVVNEPKSGSASSPTNDYRPRVLDRTVDVVMEVVRPVFAGIDPIVKTADSAVAGLLDAVSGTKR